MSNRSQSQYLRIFDNAGTYRRWQSYYIGQTVTWNGGSWGYHPFTANGVVDGSAGSTAGVTIEIPATAEAVATFAEALSLNRLCEVRMYEFDSRLTQVIPQSTQVLIGRFQGEVIGISGSFTTITISLGSSLSPVGAQVPPRKFTSILIGAPLRL